jgi:hypothetical protein
MVRAAHATRARARAVPVAVMMALVMMAAVEAGRTVVPAVARQQRIVSLSQVVGLILATANGDQRNR